MNHLDRFLKIVEDRWDALLALMLLLWIGSCVVRDCADAGRIVFGG